MKRINPTRLESMTYIGCSMYPTLKPGERLQITPYERQRIRRGDVIVFIPPGGDSTIVHRVVLAEPKEIKTRGDNSNDVDPWVLGPDQIFGRVVYAERGKRLRKVAGGLRGFTWITMLRAMRSVGPSLLYLLQPPYHWLVKNEVLREWRLAQIKPRVISFERSDGTELQLIVGRTVIGRWLPGRRRWHIRLPYRLFLD